MQTSRRFNDPHLPQGSCSAFRIRPAADRKLCKDETLVWNAVMSCVFMLLLQVANLKKESEFHWYKEDTEIVPDVKPDLGAGVCKLPIKLVIEPSNTNIYYELSAIRHYVEGLWWVIYSIFLLQFSLKTTGIYKATISDDRGKDMSQIDVSGKGKCMNGEAEQ